MDEAPSPPVGSLLRETHDLKAHHHVNHDPWESEVTVDGALAALIRHHTSDEHEFLTVLAFCQEPFSTRQLGIVLSTTGRRLPLLVDSLYVERKNRATFIKASLRFDLKTRWEHGKLKLDRARLPDTLAAAAIGRRLGEILEHPYLPSNVLVRSAEEQHGQWVLGFADG